MSAPSKTALIEPTMSQQLLTRLQALRSAHLDDVLDMIRETILETTPEGSSLPEMCDYHIATGGKRLRALLPLLVADVLGTPPERLVPFAAACEILHNATLVHDDLQDGDETRRGEPSIWAKYGEARAINLGDAMLFYTMLLAARLDEEPATTLAVNQRILRETLRVIDGQEREFLLQAEDRPTRAGYFAMVEGKTSGLFALPVAGAAMLCGAESELVDALAESASHLGVLFQIQDDLLDLYGDKGRDFAGSDIAEGKISALVVHALEHGTQEEASWLRELLRRDRSDVDQSDVAAVLELFKRTGAKAAGFAEMDRRRSLALDSAVIVRHPDVRALLQAMADLFLEPIAGIR
jgi:geranylgeranyl pyrophosphate synthase